MFDWVLIAVFLIKNAFFGQIFSFINNLSHYSHNSSHQTVGPTEMCLYFLEFPGPMLQLGDMTGSIKCILMPQKRKKRRRAGVVHGGQTS